MKIRSIKCHHKVFDPHITVDFSSKNKDLNGLFCLHGSTNAGKSLILNGIANRWSQHALSNDDTSENLALMDIEFDMDRLGILSVSRTNVPSINRQRFKDHSKITDSVIYGAVMYYPIDRCFLTEESTFHGGSAASGIFSIYSDIKTRKIQNSTILIDDIDYKLDQDNFILLYRFLSDFAKDNNNQIISTISRIENLTTFDNKKRFNINIENNIIEDILNGKIEINGH
jgi:hypothetical protein|tara:strand:+ start:487 stop:1170 length:684 start_codon:yes stop_codon:yes gene_type:complete